MEGIKNEVIDESFDLARFGILPYTAVYFAKICGVNLFT